MAELTADPKAIWRISKWARTRALEPPAPPQFPALEDQDKVLQDSNLAKTAILTKQFFPPPLEADLADIEGYNYPHPVTIPQEVTSDHVLMAIKRLPPDKAPGPDKIVNRFLIQCRETLKEPLAKLFHKCLQLAHHPLPFKDSITVVLRKPQRPTYTVAKAYRPIALLNTMGKLLEWIVADRISSAAETHSLLPQAQMGARRNRSAASALELLTEQIHTVWAQDKNLVASILSLDITGAYDHVSHHRLLHNLRAARLPN